MKKELMAWLESMHTQYAEVDSSWNEAAWQPEARRQVDINWMPSWRNTAKKLLIAKLAANEDGGESEVNQGK